MRLVLGVGSGNERKLEFELPESAGPPFTMHATLKGKDVVVEGRRVSGNGLALGCAPVEQVR